LSFCSVEKIRLVSGLESNHVSDRELAELRDRVATPELNKDVLQKVENEEFHRISEEKENRVDGENTSFYLQEPHYNELKVGDRNNDGEVDIEDVDLFFIDDGVRTTEFTSSLVDADRGELEVRDADGEPLSGGELYAEYAVTPLSMSRPHRLIETAAAQLTAAYAFTNVEAAKLESFSVGNVSINEQMDGARTMRDEYHNTLRRINQTQLSQTSENRNTISGVFTSSGDVQYDY
jgi:regulator of replication initiation timing